MEITENVAREGRRRAGIETRGSMNESGIKEGRRGRDGIEERKQGIWEGLG